MCDCSTQLHFLLNQIKLASKDDDTSLCFSASVMLLVDSKFSIAFCLINATLKCIIAKSFMKRVDEPQYSFGRYSNDHVCMNICM